MTQQCKFYVERKKRFCKLAPMPNCDYCGEHLPKDCVSGRGARVPCPYDSSHTVFESDLDSHLYKCNSRPRKSIYETKDVNLVSQDTYNARLCNVLEIEKRDDIIVSLIDKVLPIVNDFTSVVYTPPIETLKSRNAVQLDAISSCIDISKLDDYTLIEVGAGKAKLSHHFVMKNASNTPKQVFLIDRASCRGKLDQKISNIGGHAERIKCDLRDLDFSKMQLLTRNVVILAKHACGEATCFTLTAIAKAISLHRSVSFYLAIAPCCHQVCSMSSFCFTDYLSSLSIDPHQFLICSRITSWAVCSLENDRVIRGYRQSEIGQIMKTFIDICRVSFLNSIGMKASLKTLCDPMYSPENKVIVAEIQGRSTEVEYNKGDTVTRND